MFPQIVTLFQSMAGFLSGQWWCQGVLTLEQCLFLRGESLKLTISRQTAANLFAQNLFAGKAMNYNYVIKQSKGDKFMPKMVAGLSSPRPSICNGGLLLKSGREGKRGDEKGGNFPRKGREFPTSQGEQNKQCRLATERKYPSDH